MESNTKLNEINYALNEIIKILKTENENIWIESFKKMQTNVQMAIDSSVTESEVRIYLEDALKSIYKGNGSFSDFSIWRDNFNERVRLNKIFEEKVKSLKELLRG